MKGDSPWACVVSVRGHSSNLHFDHFSLQAVGMTSTFGATLQVSVNNQENSVYIILINTS